MCHRKASSLQSHGDGFPNCSIVLLHLAITCWVVGGGSTSGFRRNLRSSSLIKDAPLSEWICRHSKDGKELAQTLYDVSCADILAWEHKRESAVLINYVEEVNILVV